MSVRAFFDDTMRSEVARAVAEAETRTGAEIVVCMRRWSGSYPDAAWRGGAAFAFVAQLLLLFLPQEFAVEAMPVDVMMGFLIGWGLVKLVPPVRGLLTGPRTKDEAVSRAAAAQMFEGGVTRTSRRHGVLVYVSALERRVRVVFDEGLSAARSDAAVAKVVKDLERATNGFDRPAFVAALRALGPALAPLSPRAHDDANELPDEADA
jgi:putative membrane protein